MRSTGELAGDQLIVGFSLRPNPQHHTDDASRDKCALLNAPALKFKHPISLGFDFWDIVEPEDFASERNGINLLSIPDTFGLDAANPDRSILLAVAMRSQAALQIEEPYGLCLLPVGLIAASPNWSFLGFDVVAPGGLTSALYGFDWSDFAEAGKKQPRNMQGNQYGLITREDEAVAFAKFLNDEGFDHAPFYSMGLWMKVRTQKRAFASV